jgi:hypothetical protein
MMASALWLLADAATTTKFEWGRIQADYEWWMYGGILLALLAPLFWIYRRDTSELPWYLRIGLPLLRTLVLIGLLVVYLQPRWRSEREVHLDSRVLMLVDTSLSMGLDKDGGHAGPARLQQVAAGLDNTEFLARLRKKHQVTVVPFNSILEEDRRVVLPCDVPSPAEKAGNESGTSDSGNGESASGESSEHVAAVGKPLVAPPAWNKQLLPGGTETRLGEALEQLLRKERSTPVSGIVLVSDGGLNAGASPDTALELARESHIPIYTIGIGSDKKPVDVHVAEFSVPSRVFPGDRFSVEGSIQGYGLTKKSIHVELLARDGADAKNPSRRGQGRFVDAKDVVLLGDGEAVPVKFELPPSELGHHVLCLRVKAPAGSSDASDKFLEGVMDCSDHQTHVLLMAGGPLRDYQYLRTLLFRDKSVKVDVLLQSGQPGMSQEATKLLDDFPESRQEMADYDCLVAFDPDWKALKPEQVDSLFDWVDQDHGGMIVVAGSVNAGRASEGWVQDAGMSKIRRLYPVDFNSSVSGMRSNVTYSSEEPCPLEFTREGLQAAYLWLGESADASHDIWSQFSGVYSFCPVRDKKAGATVLARFGDSRAAQGGLAPIYMAVQRYSASPILYLGSAETWRLRRLDPAWFDQFWTKSIRFVAQEHLRRQSARGSLSIDRDRYTVGSSVEVRAQLKNSRMLPLPAPSVTLYVTRDGVDRQELSMPADPTRAGRFLVELPVLRPGEYNLELVVPETADERLHQAFRAVVPRLEEENPQRNAALLIEIAAKTNGKYYDDLAVALSGAATPSLVDRLKDVSRTESIPLAPKPEEDEKWLKWMLVALCAVLSLEWLVRRLYKLA